MKQSPKQWYKKFDSFMMSQNYTRSEYYHYMYFKILTNAFIVLVLYVNNMYVSSKIMEGINRLKD